MGTYSDYEQRQLDQESGAELDRIARRSEETSASRKPRGKKAAAEAAALARKHARISLAWAIFTEASLTEGEVFYTASSGYDNACATHGQRNEGTEEFALCMIDSMCDLLTPRSGASEATIEWFAARGVVA